MFAAMVLAALALPQRRGATYTMAPESVDRMIGTSTFKIARCGEDTCMEPLLAPGFRMHLLKGDGKQPDTITHCGVFERVAQVDQKEMVVYTLTVLKCGGNEYGIAEVDFRFDGEEKK